MTKGYQALSVETSEHGAYGSVDSVRVSEEGLANPSSRPLARANAALPSVTGAMVRGHGSLLSVLSIPSLVLIAFCVCIGMIIIGFACYKYSEASACLGPPYLYVTHSKEHNIIQLTRDGCMHMSKTLFGVPRANMELRTMVMNQYEGEPALYVADAKPETSQVLIFGDCSYWTGMRTYRASVFTRDGPYGEGAQHAYGIAFDFEGNIYASFQHTNAVLRAAKDSFETLPEIQDRRLLQTKTVANDTMRWAGSRTGPYLATFFQFGDPMVQNPQDQGVRGIAWTASRNGPNLWINNELDNAIYVVDKKADKVAFLDVKKPVGIYHNPTAESGAERQLVYVGSRGKKSGFVYAYDKDTFELVKQYTLIGMTHPTGIAVHDDTLFVADQRLGAILTFNLNTTQFIKNIWARGAGGDIEHIALTNC